MFCHRVYDPGNYLIVELSSHGRDIGGFCAPFLFIDSKLSVAYLKPFNVDAYIKTERILKKDKTDTTTTAATTAVHQSAVRLQLLCFVLSTNTAVNL